MLITNLIFAQISLFKFSCERNYKKKLFYGLKVRIFKIYLKNVFQFIFESTLNFTISPSDNLFLKYYCQR